ncbi:MAG: CFI-box-CTERM domain-containing protein [Planctomycetota bacterium]|nr:CFI-box-CTERM domain-containing protein [Planctomycetota bacterium]
MSISFNPVSLSFIIAYYNGLTDRAYFAAYEDDTWVIRQIPAQFDAGRHIKLQVNSIGQPFFCYQEFSQGGRRDLKLTYYSLGKWYFIPLSTTGNTGYYNNIQFDQYGYPIVYTLDKENSRIRQYAWTGMQWTVQDCATDVAAQPMGLTTDFDGERVLFFFNEDTIHQSKPTEDTGNGGTGGGDDDIGTGSSGCFIATAAFGSYNAGEVRKLTSLRDGVVAASYQGSSLVNLYYSVSPCMADAIRSREAVRSLVSRILCTD